MDPAARTTKWVHEVVVGLGLCPFARSPVEAGRMRVVVDEADGEHAEDVWLDTQREEVDHMLGLDAAALETTLMVFPHAPEDFLLFLELVERHDRALVHDGHEGVLQLVSFHPHYEFGDAPVGDRAHATNRSPYPTLQLLREDSVTRAVEAHPDPGGIWRRNQRVLRALSDATLESFRAK